MTIRYEDGRTFLIWPTLGGATVRLTGSTGEYREVKLDRTQLGLVREFISDMEALRKEMDIVIGGVNAQS